MRDADDHQQDDREPDDHEPEYGAKYEEAIADGGVSLPDLAVRYSTVIIVTPTDLMAW